MGFRGGIGWVTAAVLVFAGVTTGASASADAEGPPAKAHTDRGVWQVRSAGEGRYVVAWTSPKKFPMTSDRPTIVGADGAPVGVSTIANDRRTVRAEVTSTTRPSTASLDVLLSGQRLDAVDGQRPRAMTTAPTAPADRLDLPGTVTLPDDPATPGPYDVTTSDYELDPVKLPGMREPIEMVGHVVEPTADAATGPRPLVLFLHGRHSVCYNPDKPNSWDDAWPCQAPQQEIPSQLGYDYVQRVLASQGYATVSVRVNGINAQDYRLDDGGADARAKIVERHLDYWTGLAAEHQVDMDRVVLVGHSRGGEGVDRASIQIPLSAPYRIAGQVLVAPTNFGVQTAAYVPTVTLLPYCDGDVFDLQGQSFIDSSRDLTDDDTSFKSSVLVMGANHNFFNTEWTPGLAQAPAWDDWGGGKDTCGSKNPDRLRPKQQQAVGTAYIAGAVHLFANDDQSVLPLFDGSRARVDSTGTAQVLSHAIGGGRDVRAPGRDTSIALADGATTRMCQGTFEPSKVASCGNGIRYGWVFPHWGSSRSAPVRNFFEMAWTSVGQSGGLLLKKRLDLSTGRLEVRTIVDPRSGPVRLQVRITDADGASATLTPVAGGQLPALNGGSNTAKYLAQTLVADPAGATGVDLTRIARVDLVAGSGSGRVWVVDLASAPSVLAPVPERRLPTVDIGRVRMAEGDKRAPMLSVPFQVVGEVTRPAKLVVLTAGQQRGQVQRFTVDIAPGQKSGTIPVYSPADRRDDPDRTITMVAAWAGRNLMTDAYIGRLTVLDDDPTPAISVRPVKRSIREGQPARWQVRLDARVDYDLFAIGRVVRGPRPVLKAGDVPAKWLRDRVGRFDPKKPLWTYRAYTYERIRPGQRSVTLSIPTRKDGVAEPRESLTLKLRVGHKTVTRTVYIARSS